MALLTGVVVSAGEAGGLALADCERLAAVVGRGVFVET